MELYNKMQVEEFILTKLQEELKLGNKENDKEEQK